MRLPHFLAKPIFHFIYWVNRRMEGRMSPPIRRTIKLPDEEQRIAFDRLFDSAQQRGINILIDYHLPYPKSDFLNYLCDWRGFAMHGSPLQDLDTLQPIRKSKYKITHATDFPDRRPFPILDHLNAELEAWESTNPIVPLARLKLKPQDFPYLDRVQFTL